MSNIIAVTNQKGGVGKTTTAVNVAFYLAKRGYRVLIVDFDPQGNATSSVGIDKEKLKRTMLNVVDGSMKLADVIQQTDYKDLSIAPSTPMLADAEPGLANMPVAKRFVVLRQGLAEVVKEYDFIVIDSPPSLSLLTVNTLVAANYVLLPVQAEFFAMEGMSQLLSTIQLIRKNGLNPKLDILGVLPTMVGKNILARQVVEQIRKHFPGKVFKTVVPRNVRIAEAPSYGMPVGVYDKRSKGAKAYAALVKEILGRVK